MTGVFLEWGPLRVTRLDGTFTESQDPFEIPWVFFLNKGVTHKEEGIGPPTRHSIMIDMKEHDGSTAPRTDISPAFPREGAEEELDSPRVMVWDVSPGQRVRRFLSTCTLGTLSRSFSRVGLFVCAERVLRERQNV